MLFIPTPKEESYIDIFSSSTRGEYTLIRMTTTMLTKSIIDASEPFRLLVKDNLGIDYKSIKQGPSNKIIGTAKVLILDKFEDRRISYYRPNTKKGDPRFWVSRLNNVVNAGDMVLFTVWNQELYIIPLIGNLDIFKEIIHSTFKVSDESLPSEVLELKQIIHKIYEEGWIKTKKAGDTGVGFTFESLIGISANSDKNPDYKGIEIKCARSNGRSTTNLQTLFAKTPNYANIPNKRTGLVKEYGYWDDQRKRYALYMTISTQYENSKGWKLVLDHENEMVAITKHNNLVVFYEYDVLRESLAKKHKQTIFIKAESRNRNKSNDPNEEFWYNAAYYCEESSFLSFINLLEEGKITLDFAIHHDPSTGKTRDHGFLWRIGREHIPLLFKHQYKIL